MTVMMDTQQRHSPCVNQDGAVMIFNENLVDQMANIRRLVVKYPYIALDCVWPGNGARAVGDFGSVYDFQYQCLRCNVTMSKVLQLSLTMHNVDGERPSLPDCHTYTFNFHFSPGDDLYVQDSYQKLVEAGVPFVELEKRGIKWINFGQMLVTSGLVCMDNVHWIVFNGAWDLGFVMRTMLRRRLDADADKYNELLHMFFKNTHDVRVLMLECPTKEYKKVNIGNIYECAKAVKVDISAYLPLQSSTDSQIVGKMFFALRKSYSTQHVEAFKQTANVLFEFRCPPGAEGGRRGGGASAGNQLVTGLSALTSNILTAREYCSPSPLTITRGKPKEEQMNTDDSEVLSSERRPVLAAPGSQRHKD